MAIARSRLTAQAQISVPVEVRRKLGVGPGATLEWVQEGDDIVVRRTGRFTSAEVHEAIFKTSPRPRTARELKEGLRSRARRRHARR